MVFFLKMLHENLLITKRLRKFANNRQQLLVEGFSFYAVAEISTALLNGHQSSPAKKASHAHA